MVRSLCLLFLVLGLTLSVGVALGQSVGVPVPISIGAHASVPTGLQTAVTFDARGLGGASNAGYYTRPVLVSNNTLGALANGLVRRAAPVAAMAAAIAAAGWAIDSLTKQVMDAGSPGTPITGNAWCDQGTPVRCSATLEGWFGYTPPTYPGPLISIYQNTGAAATLVNAQGWGFPVRVLAYNPALHINLQGAVAPKPVPLADLAQVVKDNPGLWPDVLRNADGSVNRNPDVQAAAQALANELANQSGTQPDPTLEWNTGLQGGEAAPGASADLPVFCTWATVVCEWLNWTKQPPVYGDDDQFELPVVDPLENAPTWNSGLGNGVCPAPRVVDTFVGTISIPFDIFCQLAELLRGLVLAAAYLSAAYILLGVRRG